MAQLPVTPNAVTLAGLVVGVIAASQFWYATPNSAMLGLLLYFLQAVVDHVDGELARLTGQVSKFGAWLDVGVDTATDILIVVGMAVTAGPRNGPLRVALSALAGAGIALCSLFTNFFPPPAGRGVARATLRLANRDPVYFILAAFLVLLWKADWLLPLFIWVLVIGSHAYWLAHFIQRTVASRSRQRRG
ncbi:MAG: CDP-alcohol phosphatidyltransferase family protein [Candidatus Rokubacteria bacterium]|nr:CDP-alcohol phosphatidyltransferase family protein [Candidatus Rokubacteria bacterium]